MNEHIQMFKMGIKTYRFMRVILVVLIASQIGCIGRQYVASKRWYFPKELAEAERVVEDARKAGKDKECPEEFKSVEKIKDEAFDIYRSCKDKEAIAMANDAIAKTKALCPEKITPSPVTKPSPSPLPLPLPSPKPTVDKTTLSPSVKEPPAHQKETQKAEQGVVDTLSAIVYFDFDKHNIRKGEEAELKKAIEFVRKYAGYKIKIEGHTCSIGTEKYNQGLSERRANAIRRYLTGKGDVDGTKISTKGYGESKPIASNRTKMGRAKNRRAELLILPE